MSGLDVRFRRPKLQRGFAELNKFGDAAVTTELGLSGVASLIEMELLTLLSLSKRLREIQPFNQNKVAVY